MKNENVKNNKLFIRKMPKFFKSFPEHDLSKSVDFFRAQANYAHFKHSKLDKTTAMSCENMLYDRMTKDFKGLSPKSRQTITNLNLKKMPDKKKYHLGSLALQTHVLRGNPTINPKNIEPIHNFFNNIRQVKNVASQRELHHEQYGIPLKSLMIQIRPQDRIEMAHLVRDTSRLNWARSKHIHLKRNYSKDFKRNRALITPQGYKTFQHINSTQTPYNLYKLSTGCSKYITKYNQKHVINMNSLLSTFDKHDRIHAGQYMNDISKSYYFSMHDNIARGNSLHDKGEDAKNQLTPKDQKNAKNIIKQNVKNRTLSQLGFKAHDYVNKFFKQRDANFTRQKAQEKHATGKKLTHTSVPSNKGVNLAQYFLKSTTKKNKTTKHHHQNAPKAKIHKKTVKESKQSSQQIHQHKLMAKNLSQQQSLK